MNRKHLTTVTRLLGIVALLGLGAAAPGAGQAQGTGHFFPETKHTVSGAFWAYWQAHGGLAQQGFPISDEMHEKSDLNGQTYTVQYFERAVFEKHPENAPPFDVLLSQLGTFQYKAKYQAAPAAVAVREFDFDFAPRTITITAGTKVIWTNDGPTDHTVADRDVTWSSDTLHKGDSYSHVFTTPGTVTVICTLHPDMVSTVIVK